MVIDGAATDGDSAARLGGGLVVDLRTGALSGPVGGGDPLTGNQLAAFRLLWSRVGQVVSYDELHRELWPGVALRDEGRSSSRNRIKQLKFQIEQRLGAVCPGRPYLESVRARGLRLCVAGATPGSGDPLLIGREATLLAIAEALAGASGLAPAGSPGGGGDGRLVWVHGVDGVGRTAVLRAALGGGGAPVVELGDEPGPDEIRGRIERAMGGLATVVASDDRGVGAPALPEGGVRRVIAVDGADPSAHPALRSFAHAVPGLRLIVGSRHRPPELPAVEIPPLGAADAARLVTEALAQALGRAPRPATVERVVQRIGGFPAALRAAAEAVAWLGEDTIDAGGPDPWVAAVAADERRLAGLDPTDRSAIAACATFAGPFTPGAVATIDATAAPRLRSLYERGFVGGPTTAMYLAPSIAAALPPSPRHREAHHAWALGLAATLVPRARLGAPDARARMRAHVPELDRVAEEAPPVDASRAVLALAEVDALGPDPLPRLDVACAAPDPEARARLARGLALRRLNSPAAEGDLRAAAGSPVDEVRARAWMALGLLARDGGLPELALAHLDRARSEAAGVTWIAGRVEANRVTLLGRLGRWEEAARAHTLAMDLATRAGDLVTQARALGNRAIQLRRQGEADLAYELGVRELDAHRALGDVRAVATALGNLAAAAFARGDLAAARARLEGAVEANQAIGNRAHAATARCNLGLLACAEGRLAEAAQHLASVRSELAELGSPADEALATANHGVVRVCGGHVDDGLALLERGASLAERSGAVAVREWARTLTWLIRVARAGSAPPESVDPQLLPPWLMVLRAEATRGGRGALTTWCTLASAPEVEAVVVRRMLRAALSREART